MGSNATISALSSSNWDFVQWTDNDTLVSTDSIYSFVVNNNRQFAANFIQVNGIVSTASVPPVGGTTIGGGLYSVGDWATVTASANQDYTFDYWEEDSVIVSTDSVFTFEVIGDHSLTANFHYLYYDVTTTADPVQGGNTSGDGTYLEGDSVTITASSNPYWFFESWTEDDSVITTDSIYSFEIYDNRDFVAHYSGTEYSITTSAVPSEAGYTTGDGLYNFGITATVSAFTNLNWTFGSWTEADTFVSSENVYSFEVTQDRDLQANFFRDTCEIITEANPPEGGITSGDGVYIQGDMVILYAEPNENYILVSWTEDDSVLSTNPEYVFYADHSCLINANFEVNTSLLQFREDEFALFPNPASHYIRLILGNRLWINIDMIEIVDLRGNKFVQVPVGKSSGVQMDVTGLKSGVYVVRLLSEETIRLARKVVILH
jgi:hypothetical protein